MQIQDYDHKSWKSTNKCFKIQVSGNFCWTLYSFQSVKIVNGKLEKTSFDFLALILFGKCENFEIVFGWAETAARPFMTQRKKRRRGNRSSCRGTWINSSPPTLSYESIKSPQPHKALAMLGRTNNRTMVAADATRVSSARYHRIRVTRILQTEL